jgi:hypothetical protein
VPRLNGARTSSNTSLQRTRRQSLRSFLLAAELDIVRRGIAMRITTRLFALTLTFVVPLCAACSDRPDPSRNVANPARYTEIRRAIRSNLHFNPHCWCMAAEQDTITTARAIVTPLDIPTLIDLLADPRRQVQLGARGVLVRLGSDAVPALNAVVESRGPSSFDAREALLLIDVYSKRPDGPAHR